MENHDAKNGGFEEVLDNCRAKLHHRFLRSNYNTSKDANSVEFEKRPLNDFSEIEIVEEEGDV